MSDPYDLSILLDTLDGQSEWLGAEAMRFRGVHPEGFQASAGEVQGIEGSDTCGFQLRRDPGAIMPDLSAFTPAKVWIAGAPVWSGRVKEVPTREGDDAAVSVQGQGVMYHLDDDLFQRAYVHARVSEYRDVRSFLAAPLANFHVAGVVSQDGGLATMGWPNGAILAANNDVGVMLDLGTAQAKRVVVEWESSNNGGTTILAVCSGMDAPDFVTGIETAFSFTLNSGASGTSRGTFAAQRRYVAVWLTANAGVTLAADLHFRIKAIRVFADTAYESGDASILRADHLVTDALDKATLLLHPDRSGIVAGQFVGIPDHVMGNLRTPREAWAAANAYENYQCKIDVDGRPIFAPQPSAPIHEIGGWSGAEFEDASGSSGDEILNRTLLEGTAADGTQTTIERAAGQQPGAQLDRISTPAPTNPTFDVNTTGWTASAGDAITRDTGVFDSTPASGRWDVTGAATLTGTFTGTFTAGLTYALAIRFRGDITTNMLIDARLGDLANGDFGSLQFVPAKGSFTTVILSWTPSKDRASVTLEFSRVPAADSGSNYVDSLQLYRAIPTLVDRRGFRKTRALSVSHGVTQASGQRIADLYLGQHRTTPFAGGFKATGVGGIRRVIGGQGIHPAWLLRDVGQMVRATHRIDPDTGAVGRDERIKSVSYDHDTLTATVSLAEDRGGFEALLARLAVVTGGQSG